MHVTFQGQFVDAGNVVRATFAATAATGNVDPRGRDRFRAGNVDVHDRDSVEAEPRDWSATGSARVMSTSTTATLPLPTAASAAASRGAQAEFGCVPTLATAVTHGAISHQIKALEDTIATTWTWRSATASATGRG